MKTCSKGKQKTQERKKKGLSQQEANTTTLRNRTESPLLRLPGEIRNRIYDYIFSIGDIYFRSPFSHYHAAQSSYASREYNLTHLLSVPTTCRQIHSESALLILEKNQINIVYLPGLEVGMLWYELQPHQRAAVKALRIAYGTLREISMGFKGEGAALGTELSHFVGLKKVEVVLDFEHTDAAKFEKWRNELWNAVAQNVGRHVQVTCK